MPTSGAVTLSTGHEVRLPLVTEASMRALVVSADADAARDALPAGLAPVRCRPERATLTLLSVAYDRIGDDAMAPYDEFGVVLPAAPAGGAVPELAALTGRAGGHVGALPVTTEPARALGTEVWGYPKSVLDIDVADRGERRRTLVRGPAGHAVTLDVPPSPAAETSLRTASFTDRDGTLERQPLTLRGAVGARPFPRGADYALGEHPLAEGIRSLGPGRPLLAGSFDGEFVVGAGERV